MTASFLGRRLEGIEKLAAISNAFYHGCFNLVTMLEVVGPLTEELIQRSMEHIQQKFACLRVEIVQASENSEEWKFKESTEIAKLRVVNNIHPEQHLVVWRELTSACIDGLAWRIVWLKNYGGDKSYLFGLFHHAIFDGVSMAHFFDSLLQLSHQMIQGIPIDTPIIQPIVPTVHRFVRARWPLIALARMGYYHYRRRLRTMTFDPQGENIEDRRWHSIFRTVENHSLEALLSHCRRQSVTIRDAFSAAIILEVANRIRQTELKPFDLALCTTVDLRRFYNPRETPSPPEMGALLSAIHSYVSPKSSDTLWKMAKEVAKKIQRSIRWKEDRHLSLFQTLLGSKLIASLAQKNQGRPPESFLLVTNMGRFTQFEHGPFRVTAIHATAAQALWGGTFLLGFITVSGRLCISLGYPFPSVSDTTAEAILDGIIHRLLS